MAEVFESGIFMLKVQPTFYEWSWELWLEGDRELVDHGGGYDSRSECIRVAINQIAGYSDQLVELWDMISEDTDED